MNPLTNTSLATRDDAQRTVRELLEPLAAHRSDGGARVKSSAAGAIFPDVDAELEGFSRPLWGLASLAAGGGEFDNWDRVRDGLAAGTDPEHPEYWGEAGDYAQKHVELAAIGFGLAVTPEELWDPLDVETQDRLAAYLGQINDADLHPSNWLFFRVLTNLGLRAVDAPHDWELTRQNLDTLESFSLSNGWYEDGDGGTLDYYVAWEMHTDGLLYAALAGEDDSERADRFRERAREFAIEYREWFRGDGPALPLGRSLTYRFAQAAFWGALAVADVQALPWGEIRGLWARNVRWWLEQPIFAPDGTLSVGYGYPTLKTSEGYNSPSSPYWAMKAFLPLALDADHPFWQAEERPPEHAPSPVVQSEPGLVICRDEGADHHFALAAGQDSHYREKYAKFAYSTDFGFSVRSRAPGLAGAGHDSSLALRGEGGEFRSRVSVAETAVEGTTLYSRWEPWPDVSVETWLAPDLPWHVRLHRLETDRALEVAEGGFPLERTGGDGDAERRTEPGTAYARTPGGTGGLLDLRDDREGRIVDQDPNTNLRYPRTTVPTLIGECDPGIEWFATAVTAARPGGDDQWAEPPVLDDDGGSPVIRGADGDVLLRCEGDAPGSLAAFPE